MYNLVNERVWISITCSHDIKKKNLDAVVLRPLRSLEETDVMAGDFC